jgi:hypothetical protein
MTSRWRVLCLGIPLFALGCAGAGSQQEQAPDPAVAAGDCGGKWVIEVRNETYESVDVFYMQSKLATTERAGTVNAQDTRSFYVRAATMWEVWAAYQNQRILVRDRPAQQRFRVYLGVGCDSR